MVAMANLRPEKMILRPLMPKTRIAKAGRHFGDQLFWGIPSHVGALFFMQMIKETTIKYTDPSRFVQDLGKISFSFYFCRHKTKNTNFLVKKFSEEKTTQNGKKK